MSPADFLSLLGFAFVTTATPGPNNLVLMTSGANFGFRRTIPLVLGILIGYSVLILLAGFGLTYLLERLPALQAALKTISIGYLLWLTWQVAKAAAPENGLTDARPLTFFAGRGLSVGEPESLGHGPRRHHALLTRSFRLADCYRRLHLCARLLTRDLVLNMDGYGRETMAVQQTAAADLQHQHGVPSSGIPLSSTLILLTSLRPSLG